jgi:hypothetical protein
VELVVGVVEVLDQTRVLSVARDGVVLHQETFHADTQQHHTSISATETGTINSALVNGHLEVEALHSPAKSLKDI